MPKGAGEEKAAGPLCDSVRACSGEGLRQIQGRQSDGRQAVASGKGVSLGRSSVKDERVVPRGKEAWRVASETRLPHQEAASEKRSCGLRQGRPDVSPQSLGAEAGTRGQAA